MISIREEIREIEQGRADRENNLLKNAPHSPDVVRSSRLLMCWRARARAPLPGVPRGLKRRRARSPPRRTSRSTARPPTLTSVAPWVSQVLADKWDRPYPRERAAFPAPWVRQAKFWPTVSRVDNVYGDRNLITRLQEPVAATA